MTYQNANKVILKNNYKKTKEIINNWNERNWSIIGKNTIVKFLLLPNITYIASGCTIPKECIQRFKAMIYNFIWGGKKDRIKRTDLCKDYSKGVLKMIDIDQYFTSIQIYWLKRLTTSTPMISNWNIYHWVIFKNVDQIFSFLEQIWILLIVCVVKNMFLHFMQS